MKISSKITLIFIAIFTVISALTSFIIYNYSSNIFRDELFNDLSFSGQNLVQTVRTYLGESKKTSAVLAGASIYRDFLKESTTSAQYKVIKTKINNRLDRTLKVDENMSEVFILDKNGKVIASSDKNQEGKDKANDLFFINAQKEIYFKDIYLSQTTNRANFAISAPIKDDTTGELLGVSVVRYEPNVFNKIFTNFGQLYKTKEAFLINKDLYFLTKSLFEGDSVILNKKVETQNAKNCYDPKEVDYLIKNGYTGFVSIFGNQAVEDKDYRGVDIMSTHNYIPETGWCLITKINKSEFLIKTNLIFTIFLYSFIISLIILIIFSYIFSQQITKPIKELKNGIEIIAKGDLNYKVGTKSKDEIGQLSRSFDDMTNKLADNQKNIENKVQERTKELQEINQHMVNRELKMIELKQKIKEISNEK